MLLMAPAAQFGAFSADPTTRHLPCGRVWLRCGCSRWLHWMVVAGAWSLKEMPGCANPSNMPSGQVEAGPLDVAYFEGCGFFNFRIGLACRPTGAWTRYHFFTMERPLERVGVGFLGR